MKILVTGARGFVGFAVAEVAAQQGAQVWGIGRTSQAPAGWPGAYHWADVAFSDLTPIIEICAPDVVFHGAGSASVGQSFEAPLDDFRASTLTFINLLESVRRSSQRPIILFPSSAAIYGNPEHLPIAEEAPAAPISPYGFHKLQCELVAREYAECFGLDIIVGRLFSVFGARQKRLLVWELFEQFRGARPNVQLLGTGDETRDYLPADEVARLMLQMAARKNQARGESRDTGLEIYNVASGRETSIFELAQTIGEHLGCDKPILRAASARRGDPMRWCADTNKIRAILPPTESPQSLLRGSLSKVLEAWNQVASDSVPNQSEVHR